MDIMWKSSLLTESVRERGRGSVGWKGGGVMCENTEQLLFVLTPEYNLPKMVAVMTKRYMTLRKN